MGTEILITREELFRQVWEKPMTEVAKRFGISDVGLKKACKRLEVPSPPRGYWARLHAGYEPKKSKLPPASSATLLSTTINKMPQFSTSTKGLLAKETLKIRVSLPEDLKTCHPLISRTRRAFKIKSIRYKIGEAVGSGVLKLAVSQELLDRSLKIYQGIFQACKEQGWQIDSGKDEPATYIYVDGEKLEIGIKEKGSRIEKMSRYSWREFDYVESGKLTLEIFSSCHAKIRHRWNDTELQLIESHLSDFLDSLFLIAKARKVERLQESEYNRRCRLLDWQKNKEKRAEAIALKYQDTCRKELKKRMVSELNYRAFLKASSSQWETAERIRRFVAAAKKDKEDNWTVWASRVADMIDPLADGHLKTAEYFNGCDADLDCGANVSKIDFPFPSEVRQQIDDIMKEIAPEELTKQICEIDENEMIQRFQQHWRFRYN